MASDWVLEVYLLRDTASLEILYSLLLMDSAFQQGFVACEEDACPVSGLHTASGGSGRRNKVMVTDCVLMENCSKLVLALTKRELQFHDIPSGSNSGQTMKIKVFCASVTAAWGLSWN